MAPRPITERGYPLARADVQRSYFFTSEAATHFGGVPESICPEGHGSVGFEAVEGGAPEVLGADGADGMACEPVAPEVLDDEDEDLFCAKAPLLACRASIPAAMMATRTHLPIKFPTVSVGAIPRAENAGSPPCIPARPLHPPLLVNPTRRDRGNVPPAAQNEKRRPKPPH
jgi:hypothetical protein